MAENGQIDDLPRLEFQRGDDLVDLECGDARGTIEGLDPFLGGPGRELGGDRGGGEDRPE